MKPTVWYIFLWT